MSMTSALISVESAIAMIFAIFLELTAAKRFTYSPRKIIVSGGVPVPAHQEAGSDRVPGTAAAGRSAAMVPLVLSRLAVLELSAAPELHAASGSTMIGKLRMEGDSGCGGWDGSYKAKRHRRRCALWLSAEGYISIDDDSFHLPATSLQRARRLQCGATACAAERGVPHR